MTVIHPLSPARYGHWQTRSVSSRTQSQSARTLIWKRTHGWHKLLPQANIHNCVVLSKLRCIITLVSLVLLMTDIPRTGLGVRNLQEYYPVPLMPSTAVRFGPFNYPVVHIWRLDNGSSNNTTDDGNVSTAFAGVKGTDPVSAARVWSYQYDTTSIGLRGAVELLNVTEFPSYLLYKPQQGQHVDPNSAIEFSTAFTMLDAFITAARAELRRDGKTSTTLRYATKHNWVDRIHHYVVSFVSKNSAWRLHSLHVAQISHGRTKSLSICSNNGIAKRSPPRPRFCNHPGIWKCPNPLDASKSDVRLWDHMNLRLQSLQQPYPDLELDVALVSTQRLSSTSGAMRSTFYSYEALEIIVLTRGWRCVESESSKSNSTTCATVFVDDYRYERDIVQTNLVDRYGIISMLLGGAQTYVWIRSALLIYGAYTAAGQGDDGKSTSKSRWVLTAMIVMKIPFQVIVYSSVLPVISYVAALVLDSSFMDIFLDSYWASVAGSVNFELVPFLETTAVQMRSVWLLALLAFLVVYIVRKTRDHWHDGVPGVPGVRGLLINFTSTLTVAGPYKTTIIRDTNITSVFRIADEGPTMDIIRCNPGGGAVMALAMAIKGFGSITPRSSWIHRETQGVVLSSTLIVPRGAKLLWPTSVLSIRFHAATRPLTTSSPRSSNLAPSQIPTSYPSKLLSPTTAMNPTSPGQSRQVWPFTRVNDSNLRRSPLRGVSCHSTEFRSILQLMNIAMMTDPWNFFWLRVLGIQLYCYKIHRTQSVSNEVSNGRQSWYAVILPFQRDEMEEYTGFSPGDYQLLGSANSRDVPMLVLLQCG